MKPLLFALLLSIPSVLVLCQTGVCDSVPSEAWFTCSKERIRLNEQEGLFMDNLSIYKEGHHKGYFYFLHPSLPRYEPYLKYPGFAHLIEADRLLYDSAMQTSTTLYHVDLPDDFSSTVTYPLLFIFHGGNSNFQRVGKHWKQAGLDKHYIKVYLQSYRHFDSDNYTWRSGDPRADNDLRSIFREIQDHYPVDTTRIFLAGISAGANYALGMALRGIIPVQGMLAFCPGLPRIFRSEAPPPSVQTGLRVYLLGGEHDFYLEQQKELMRHLDQHGIRYTYEQVKGMGHQYPENEGKYMMEGLQFLLKE